MGIPGLTTYILKNSERFLEYYALHDSYLVIDGNNLIYQVYDWHARCNCVFGGDYDKYAQCIRKFFDQLSRCNVTPLVLFDGGCEKKKLKTVLSRAQTKIKIALDFTVSSQNKFAPLLLKEIFKDVMNEKGIRYAQCIFEADNAIAAIARILNCPVLSYDSDFYIYGSLFIPLNTLENSVIPNPTGKGYMKRCKIYHVEKLLLYYELSQSSLFLAGVLLGNDYVKQRTFRNFLRHLPRMSNKSKNNDQQQCIYSIFHWLRKRSLHQAVIRILSRLQRDEHMYILNVIETAINGYANAPQLLSILHTLNIPVEMFSETNLEYKDMFKMYKFEDNLCDLTDIDEETNEMKLSDEKETEEIENTFVEEELVSNESLQVDNLPEWFINEFKECRLPSYFIDIITRGLFNCPVQIEDPSNISSITASLKVIGVINALLVSGVKGRKPNMRYITRDENGKIKRYQLEHHNMFDKLPSLFNLRELSIVIRRGILDTILEIDNVSCINEIPSNWMLYIATIKYWINQQQEPSKFSCHVYALLFAMLFNIIDCKIGIYRILDNFIKRFNQTMNNIRRKRNEGKKNGKRRNCESQYSFDATLAATISEVDADDCLLAATFFVSNFEVNQKLCSQPKKFDITIVHSFAEFQNCLKHIINLNALLGCPYEQTKIATVYNGTLLYNLYSNFKKRDDIVVYINLILQDSPSLLHLFHMLLLKVKPLLDTALESEPNKIKKQKSKKYKRKNITHEKNLEEEEKEEEEETSENTDEVFYDINNSFSVLGIK